MDDQNPNQEFQQTPPEPPPPPPAMEEPVPEPSPEGPTSQSASEQTPPHAGPAAPPQAERIAPPAPPRKKSNAPVYIISALLGCGGWLLALVLMFLLMIVGLAGLGGHVPSTGGDKVAVIRVNGVITGGRSGGDLFSSGAGAERIIELLEKARKQDDIKAVVLRINSPGGSAAGSEEIFNEIKRVKESGKPVVASMADVAASGGYYISAPTNEIVADAATMTGSIGVIMELTNLQKLFGKIGVGMEVVKSGKFKDIGSSNRPITPEERQLLQAMINDTYQQFVSAVAEGRQGKLSYDEIKKLADGRIFTGRQAKKLRLIDTIGGLDTAVKSAARLAKISGEPTVVELGKPSIWSLFDDSSDDTTSQMARKMLTDPRFQEVYRQLAR